jgi:hypothetical protein
MSERLFPPVPRPAPVWPFWAGWGLLLVAGACFTPLVLGIPLSGEEWWRKPLNLIVAGGLFGGLIAGLLCLNTAWRHFIWRRGRIDAALLLDEDPSFLERLREAPIEMLLSVIPGHLGWAVSASRTRIRLLHIRGGRPRKFSIQASVHNFSPTRFPRAVWLVYPPIPFAKPMLVADVAPRQWNTLAAPDAIADAIETAATN